MKYPATVVCGCCYRDYYFDGQSCPCFPRTLLVPLGADLPAFQNGGKYV